MADSQLKDLSAIANPVVGTDVLAIARGTDDLAKVTVTNLFTSPTFVTPALGTPASGVLTNCTGTAAGLTAGTASAVAVGGITGLGTGVATALAVNVGSAGAPVVFNGAGGTPSSMTGTNITGTAAGLTAGTASAVAVGGITGLGTGVATALAVNVGSAGAPVVLNGALGTPSSGTATNLSGTAASLTAGAATVLATTRAIYGNNFDGSAALTQVIASTYGGTGNGFTKISGPTTTEKTVTIPDANLTITAAAATVLDDATVAAMVDTLGGASSSGSGGLVRITSAALTTPNIGTPSAGTLTNCTGLPPAGLTTAGKRRYVGFTAYNGGSAIATGKVMGFFTAADAGTIVAWSHTVDTGTPVIKVWKIADGTAKPTSANSINTSGVGVSTGTHVRSTTLSDFTSTTITAGDTFAFNIESNTGSATEMSFAIEYTLT